MKVIALVALLALSSGCASAPRGAGEMVEVEGWAAEGPGARDRAIADGLKRAVETALGVEVAARTKVEEAVTTRRRIWTAARGKAEEWRVMGERVEDGQRIVNLKVRVRRAEEGEPVPPPAEATVRVEAQGPAAPALRRAFHEGGFTVVDGKADFIASAHVGSGIIRDARTAPFVTGRTRVTVTVREADGASVAERSAEATGFDADALAAAVAAGESAGRLAGAEAAGALSDYLWKR